MRLGLPRDGRLNRVTGGATAAPAAYVGTKAGQTDGVDEVMTGPSKTLSTTGFTVTFIAKRNDGSGAEFLFHHRQTSSKYLAIYADALKLVTTFANGASIGGTTASNVLTAGQWAWIAVAFDKPSTHRLRVWVNGTLVATYTGTVTDGSNTSTFTLARQFTPASIFLNGAICEVGIWSDVWSDADNVAWYNSGVRDDPEALTGKTATALWPFQSTDSMVGTSGSIADIKGGAAIVPTNTEAGDLVAGP